MRTHFTPAAARGAVPATLALALLALPTTGLRAQVLTFEGVGNDMPVGSFYNGGPGGNLGITFTNNAFALTRADLRPGMGGSGNFGGEPTPRTAVVFSDLPGTPAYFNVAGGFTTGLGLFYSAPAVPVVVRVFSGLNATGTLLATLTLGMTPNGALAGCPSNPGAQFCPFMAAGTAFTGTARSVDFSGALNDALFDNVTLGSASFAVVPEPATLLLVAGGLLAVPAVARRRGRQRPAPR